MVTPATEVTLDQARQALRAQSFNALMGANVVAFTPGEAILTLSPGADHLQQHGLVHGGVIAYLADNAVAFAGGSILGPSVVTRSLEIELLRAASRDTVLTAIATASAHQAQDAVAVCRCEITAVAPSGEVRLVATAAGKVVRLGQRAPSGPDSDA